MTLFRPLSKYKVLVVVLLILNVLLTFNIFILPFDKMILPVYIVLLLYLLDFRTTISVFFLYLFIFNFVLCCIVLNINTSSLLILYPLLFIYTACLASKVNLISLSIIKNSLIPNIFIGLIFCILSYLGLDNKYSMNLIEKGLPFLYAPQGFSPTLQVYSTLCIIWLILDFEQNSKLSICRILVIVSLFLTLNRMSLIFFLLILFVYRRNLFYFLLVVIGLVLFLYLDVLFDMFFSLSTLNSRSELRYGAELSYWSSNDILVYLFGRGSHMTSHEVALKTIWEREYIENGLDFLLHSYGIIGLVVYIFLLLFTSFKLYLKGKSYLILFVVYYFVFVQYMTNEYLTSAIYFFVFISLRLSNGDKLVELSD